MAEKPETEDRSAGKFGAGDPDIGQASEAVRKLHSVVDQASRSIRELTEASEQWAQTAQERATAMAKELRGQGEHAVGTVSKQVEHNPLVSVALAFAVGFLIASLVRR
ncbi:MAG TPA: hypothetical protein VGR45_00505 [Stellaceae bacterium]|nr:hypothetical protein [Stellaceae bacterium]